jgi:hypothetical protein
MSTRPDTQAKLGKWPEKISPTANRNSMKAGKTKSKRVLSKRTANFRLTQVKTMTKHPNRRGI